MNIRINSGVAARTSPQRSFRGDIQGLRMVAVLAVIANHLLGWPSGGFVGVDVFFVISGFLITSLLIREHEMTGRISFVGFYRRRVKRILPAALLVIVVTLAAAYFLFNKVRFGETVWHAVWATFFGANWDNAIQGTDYFSASEAVSPLQHYWSLAVEEQFYFVWPWLMVLVYAIVAATKGTARHARGVILVSILTITLASFAWAMWETSSNPTWAYFSTFSRAWELGIGAVVAVTSPMFARLPSAARTAMSWVGLTGIIVSLFVVDEGSGFPAPIAALPVLATALTIAAGIGATPSRIWVLDNRVAQFLGNISYSLYLWHWPVIIFTSVLLPTAGPAYLLAVVVFTVTLSIASYYLVEDPARKSDWLEPRALRSRGRDAPLYTRVQGGVALGLVIVVAGAVGVGAWGSQLRSTTEGGAIPLATTGEAATIDATPAAFATPELAALQASIAEALQATEWPELDPTMDAAIAGRSAPSDVSWCGQNPVDEERCSFGDRDSPQVAVMIGSSLSMAYVATLREALPEWRVISLGMFGCPIMDSEKPPPGEDAKCIERSRIAVDAINRLDPDLVFVSGMLTPGHGRSQLGKITTDSRLVFLPGPPGEINIGACYGPTTSPADCVSHMDEDWGAGTRDIAEDLGGEFVDASVWFCHAGACPSFVGSTPMKRDAAHMTPAYAVLIAPAVRETLESMGLLSSASR